MGLHLSVQLKTVRWTLSWWLTCHGSSLVCSVEGSEIDTFLVVNMSWVFTCLFS